MFLSESHAQLTGEAMNDIDLSPFTAGRTAGRRSVLSCVGKLRSEKRRLMISSASVFSFLFWKCYNQDHITDLSRCVHASRDEILLCEQY